VALVELLTDDVVTVNEPELAPAAIEILAGTWADPLLLCSETTKPPAGAGPERVTEPLAGPPPVTVPGDRVTPPIVMVAGTGVTISPVDAEDPFALADKVVVAATVTTDVVAMNGPEVWPAGIERVAGTCTAPLLLCNATVRPPAGAGPVRATVPLTGLPPITVPTDTLMPATWMLTAAGFTTRLTEAEEPLLLAVIAAVAGLVTTEVITVNWPEVCPAGIARVIGTCAAPLLLCNATLRPPAGAGPVRVTVPLTGFPPTTVPTDNVTPATATLAVAGITLSAAEEEDPLALAVMVAVAALVTTEVLTLKEPDVWPAGIEMAGGTCAAALPLCKVTVKPPAGAGPLRVTTPLAGSPPTTVLTERVTPVTVTVEIGVIVRLAGEEELFSIAVTIPVVTL